MKMKATIGIDGQAGQDAGCGVARIAKSLLLDASNHHPSDEMETKAADYGAQG